MYSFLLTYFEANGQAHTIVYIAESKEDAANKFIRNIATPEFMYRIEVRQIAYVDPEPTMFHFEPVFDLKQTHPASNPLDFSPEGGISFP